ncbi:ferredoxin--NAD+ reductase [Amycolatopsis mediterranei S699]|uniref:Ferredoxin--NAD+ reductase n=1 Tax=Amycolatopsis mediterranei (strain U-32) TaxID=749927 RepID=A0A0H3DDC9_AMYMU|nr:FAD-dependent oxidoreductase [Amycolatopsis mediterranei]ADJ48930.1 ferredoxin--NAD+ reductase [Amycolatopsis mediterranei U32]AFO80638.1 ferredoxin--NAD+ reductase [Amycolatopsis mediterranei S699]AGT87766.1 ferredoxin--NAD+ reductase [Amycolatopsis mediterranei RB]KDU93952.1 pyridine nucleotide-disulfide oxidoreductase [Amycolatopsis mediterranei]UZF73967.1 FAD-dependent oxidoreductase [Amycolatopsis mediterranei]
MTGPARVLVVGASASGMSTVESLRRRGYAGEVVVLGDEPHAPYDRPPLSKQVLLGAWEPARAALRPPEAVSALAAGFVLGDPAVALDPVTQTVWTASGRELQADAIVIATGLRPRTLPDQEGLTGVHVLRTLDDALALRRDLSDGARVVVVGEGVLGAEITATARTLGLDVTMTGPQRAPMALQVGTRVSAALADLHQERGVRLRLGDGVVGLTAEGTRVTGVRLSTGEVLPADAVVVAIGASPATEWLAGSGLRLDNGVVCDSRCRAAEGIYAVGDVARWHHERLGRLVRLENRTNATMQAAAVAGVILGEDEPYVPVPYFWTDQFDAKLHVHGFLSADADAEVVEGDVADRRFVARYRSGGAVTGVLGWNMPKQARLRRAEIDDVPALL